MKHWSKVFLTHGPDGIQGVAWCDHDGQTQLAYLLVILDDFEAWIGNQCHKKSGKEEHNERHSELEDRGQGINAGKSSKKPIIAW